MTATFACKTGSTEPLYTYQWELNYKSTYFAAFPAVYGGGLDLDVEGAHGLGIKGQGVKLIVLDDGVDVRNVDLAGNVNASMTRNFDYVATDTTASPFGNFNGAALAAASDPTPGQPNDGDVKSAHGTNAAGIAVAAQNGVGVMGVAPRATLGGARFVGAKKPDTTEAYGGGAWSKDADIFSASYGSNPAAPPSYDQGGNPDNPQLRALVNLRAGKGAIWVKAVGNEFQSIGSRTCPSVMKDVVSCETPVNDTESLEPVVINVASANAKGVRASYSSAGPVTWVTGFGGEYGDDGEFGESGSGPVDFSTDLRGCTRGYANNAASGTSEFNVGGSATNKDKNPDCDFSTMNGTSAATPTISGVIALILQANPQLTWRDVRDILRATAVKVDAAYNTDPARQGGNRARLFSLASNSFTSNTATASNGLLAGATTAQVDYGWQANAAGFNYSNWYGFGVADASAAVNMAKTYTAFQAAALNIPNFSSVASLGSLSYGSVSRLGTFSGGSGKVDEVQVRLTGPVCIGSIGVVVKSPSGTVSVLSVPLNSYYDNGVSAVTDYTLGSYAFYGEPAAVSGKSWEIYALAATPNKSVTTACSAYSGSSPVALGSPLEVESRVITRP